MRRARASRHAPRGAAAVETAICMLIIVPVFLYALFLDDLLRYSLDVQEATVSTVWDYTVQDYSTKADTATVQHHARLMFCDHESAKGRYDAKGADGKAADCEEENHHQGTAVAAHVCWLNEEGHAKQVTCEGPDAEVGRLGADKLYTGYSNQFNHGGLIHCSARAVVENYLLPKRFLPEFSTDKKGVDLTKERWSGGSYHGNAQAGTKSSAYFTQEQRMAILVDTWALTKVDDVKPGKRDGELYQRVAHLYTNKANPGFAQVDRAAEPFFSRAKDSLLNSKFLPPSGGDDPRKPNLSIKAHLSDPPSETIRQKSGSSDYFNTEWQDWDQDRNRKTYEKRGEHYLGCKKLEDC